MITESSVEIAAPAATVWAVYSDVERWPEWTASIERLEALDGPGLAVGKRFAIKQPRLPRLVWKISQFEPGAAWTWQQGPPGGLTLGVHEVFPLGPERTLVRQRIDQRGPIGTLVCWDQWYPEGARLTALQGANILFYPTAIGWHPAEKAQYGAQQLDAWKTIQRSHAIANGCWVAAVNRVGFEQLGGEGAGIEFWGHSFVCDPFGVVVTEAGEAEALPIVEVDLARIEEVRRNWPFLRDRRTDAYDGIQHRFLTD